MQQEKSFWHVFLLTYFSYKSEVIRLKNSNNCKLIASIPRCQDIKSIEMTTSYDNLSPIITLHYNIIHSY